MLHIDKVMWGYCYSELENGTTTDIFACKKFFTNYHKKMWFFPSQNGRPIQWQENDLMISQTTIISRNLTLLSSTYVFP